MTLDNGKKELCTSDHKWLLKNGEYVEAKDLKVGDSIMPLYTSKKNIGGEYELKHNGLLKSYDYETVIQPNGTEEFTHRIADKWNLDNNIYKKE